MAGKPWSTKELAYLIEHAGRVPASEIAAYLGRTVRACEAQARRLRESGAAEITLRAYVSRVSICPRCGYPMDSKRGVYCVPMRPRPPAPNVLDGVCLPCWYSMKADEATERAERAISRLTGRAREAYDNLRPITGGKPHVRGCIPPPELPPESIAWPRRKRLSERAQIDAETQAGMGQRRRYQAAIRRAQRAEARLREQRKTALLPRLDETGMERIKQ